jgi:AraC family transcriptional regulator of adaptative response / DNA-3-methyladenine glycosylase II
MRGTAIVELARAVVADPALLQTSPSLDEAIARLTALPGIGEWTAHYIAMRALREPDAFPASDLVIRQELSDGADALAERAVIGMAEAWRPWRSYAAMYLWMARLAT